MRHAVKVSAILGAAALATLGCERRTTVVESPQRETVYSGRTVDQTRVYDRDDHRWRRDDDDRDHGRYEDHGGYYRRDDR